MKKRKPVLLNGEALMADGKVLEFDAVDQEELDGKIDAPRTAQVGEVLTVEKVDEDGKPIKWKTQTVDVDGVLKYTEQELTSEQQKQARENIGAKPLDFPVTITSTTTNGVTIFTADKTFAEIKTAYESGANVYAVDSLEHDIFPLRDINSSDGGLFSFYGVRNSFRLGIFISIRDDDVTSVYKYNLITSENIKTYAVRVWETLEDVRKSGSNCYGICKQKGDVSSTYIPDNVVFPVIIYVGTYSHAEASMQVIDADGVVWTGKFDYGTPKLFTAYPKLPSPTTAQPGQIVKVKAVDESGKITETETVDMPTQKALKWVTVHSSDLTEAKREFIISTDTDGKSIADYNPVGLSLILSTPADSTEESTNGVPWIYPSTTKFDNAIRVIGSISGWKTIARDSAFVFNGGSSAMSCSGNVNTSLPTYKLDGYALDGVRIFFNSANDHLPIGTHVEVAILCEVEE